jgi:hypothetical protein
MNRAAVQASEHLKGWVSEIVDKYHEGVVNGVEAKLAIWDEIQATLFSLKPKHFQNMLWLRIAVPEGDPEACRKMVEIIDEQSDVVSSRCIGPREGSEFSIFYVTTDAGNVRNACDIVDTLANEGYSVRDWSFGANRR